VVTVGVFDGVHVAHQQLIHSTVRLARRLKGTSVVITFDPDPQTVLHPASAAPALMPLAWRLRELKALGVDWVWVMPFSKRFARMSAEQFIRRFLIRRLRARALIVGDTFAFGRDRRGNMGVLQTLGPAHGMRIIPVKPITRSGIPVSSSRIRRLIHDGKLAQARQLLGRDPMVFGTVVRGAGRGRRLGFPTANIQLIPQVLPPRGVYAVIVDVAGRRWRGVMNLGMRPTFGQGPMVCEVHLLGFSGTLLRRAVTVALLVRLRGERRFPSPQALSRQVRRDILRAQSVFSARSLR
jgi:riboflavin kinase/FMN adenylyltransferase